VLGFLKVPRSKTWTVFSDLNPKPLSWKPLLRQLFYYPSPLDAYS